MKNRPMQNTPHLSILDKYLSIRKIMGEAAARPKYSTIFKRNLSISGREWPIIGPIAVIGTIVGNLISLKHTQDN